MNVLAYLLVNGIAIFVAAYVLPGVDVESIWTAILVAVILGVVNMFLKPVLFFLTLPITIITLGLFTVVINGLLILLVDWFVAGFRVENLLWAILFSLVISLVSSFLNMLTKSNN